jgi:hypothetical protein
MVFTTEGTASMLQRLTEIAPIGSWALLAGSTVSFVCSFLAWSHLLLVRRAYGETFRGPAFPGTLETMARWSVVFLAGGFVTWGALLSWSALALVIIGACGGTALALEAAVRLLERLGPGR